MGYSFMTFKKIKSYNAMIGKYKHNYREMYVPNADPDQADKNEELVSLNGKTYKEAFEERMKKLGYLDGGKKIRSNAVMGFEVVTTFSREDKEKIDLEKWKENNVKWLREAFNARPDLYGDNVLSVVYHGDEAGNVHCHAFVVPIDDKGHLNARYYVANRTKLINLQNSYGSLMKKEHNLQRGLPNSKARHKDIQRYYAALNATLERELPEVLPGESSEDYRKRVNSMYVNLQLKNMSLEDKMKQEELRYSQRIQNAISSAKKEVYEKNKPILKEADEIVREFGSMEECAKMAERVKNIDLGTVLMEDSDNYQDLLNRLENLGKEEKKKRKPSFDR